jgi:PAS domain S-box-containing protein
MDNEMPSAHHDAADPDAVWVPRDLLFALGTSSNLEETAHRVLDAACRVRAIDCGVIYLQISSTGDLTLLAHRGLPPHVVAAVSRFPADSPQVDLALRGAPAYRGGAELFSSPDVGQELCRLAGVRALAVLPILHDGRLVATLNLASRTDAEIPRESRRTLEAIASCLGGVIARIQATTALRENEERLRILFEYAPDACYLSDLGGTFLDGNAAAEELIGYKRHEVIGRSFLRLNLLPPSDLVRAMKLLALNALGKPTGPDEFRLNRKDGRQVAVEIRTYPVRLSGRRLAFGIVRDVTVRTQAEAALRESEDRLRTILDNIQTGVVIIDPNTHTVVDVNPVAAALIGKSRAELVGSLCHQHICPAEVGRCPITDLGQRVDNSERLLLGSDGRTRPIMKTVVSIMLGGEPKLLESFVDISERKQAEIDLRQRTEQIEAIRAVSAEMTRELDLNTLLGLIARRVTELVGNKQGGVWLWDESHRRLTCSAWTGAGGWRGAPPVGLGEGLVGIVAQRREGMIVNEYPRWPHAYAVAPGATEIAAAMAEPLLYRDRLVGVLHLASEPGEREFTETDRALLRIFADHAAVAIENARLFAELNASYRDLQQAQDELIRSEKLRALGQMAAGMAHDLNNMLATILGQAELLRLRTQSPEIREGLKPLETAAADGAEVIRRLQDFARQRSGTRLEPCDLPELVREVLEITRPRWQDEPQRQGNVISVRASLDSLPPVLGHAPEIREVLTNLIFNAVDAMPQGGVLEITGSVAPSGPGADERPDNWGDASQSSGTEPEISARAHDCTVGAAEHVDLVVSDTGIGMPEDVRARVFDPFFTTKGMKGSGLGLSVAYGIMERHRGSIRVTSAPGRGTSIRLRFQAAPHPAAPAPVERPSISRPPRRLLVIDDETAVRETLVDLLRTAGHQVVDAAGGAAGVASLDGRPFDLVLTDLGMPEVTGWDVARAVKASRPEIPVVLMTGWGELVAGEQSDKAQVDRILGKPVRLEDLLGVIQELTVRCTSGSP